MTKYLCLFILLFTCNFLFAQKDSIVLVNSNVLVGELKGLDKSILTFKTMYSDKDFKIKWAKIKEIYSPNLFIVQLTNGHRIDAKVNTDSIQKNIVLLNSEGFVLETDIKKIIFLDAIGNKFISRLSAEFDIGLTITKANNSKQFTSNAMMAYVANKWSLSGTFNAVFSHQDNVDDIKRIEGDVVFTRFLPKDWYLATSANFLSSNELKIELRTTGKLGGGYFFKHNNSLLFGGGAGIAFNNESFTDSSQESKRSLEAYIGSEFNKYKIGDLSILTSIYVYPGITEKGRYRADFKFDMKYDLPLDFYIKTGFTYNYDNQPAEGASEEDYVFQTSIGWELN